MCSVVYGVQLDLKLSKYQRHYLKMLYIHVIFFIGKPYKLLLSIYILWPVQRTIAQNKGVS